MAAGPPDRFNPPVHLSPPSLQSRSTARSSSPNRLAILDYQSIDPLLGNLSPEATLEALTSADAVRTNEKTAHDILSRSISQVSPAERALGIRAAIVAQKLGQWSKEVQGWEWPKRPDAHLGKGFVPPSSDTTDSAEPEYYGSLPAAVVDQHEKRIEEIRDELESLNVDELKEHVLNAHIPARSRPSSSNSTVSVPPPLSYVQLSDFTAVITATILRALPLLSRLNSLLATWDVRLLVLQQIPGLLRGLQRARSDLNSALDLLKSTEPPAENDPLYSRPNYHTLRTTLETTVVSAGRRMDRILDSLEGREDSLPEAWIDNLEAIEAEFGAWVMDAEKRTVQNEWRRMMTLKTAKTPEPEVVQLDASDDESDDAEHMISTELHVTCEPGRPLPMETIEEEPTSPLKPASPLKPVPVEAIESILSNSVAAAVTSVEPAISEPSSLASTDEAKLPMPSQSGLDTEPKKTADAIDTLPSVRSSDSDSDQHELVNSPIQQEKVDESVSEPTNSKEDICPADIALPGTDDDDLSSEGSRELADDASDTSIIVRFVSTEHKPEAAEDTVQIESASLLSSTELPASPLLQPETEKIASQESSGDEQDPVSDQKEPQTPQSELREAWETPAPVDERIACAQSSPVADEVAPLKRTAAVIPDAEGVAKTPPVNENTVSYQSSIPSVHSAESAKLLDNNNTVSPQSDTPQKSDEPRHPARPLDSPIKLSKSRPDHLHLDKENTKLRRSSNASAGSYSDYPSLISSPDLRGPHTTSSNGTPLPLETPPQFRPGYQHSGPVRSNNDHTLREDRLLGLDNDVTPPRTALKHNRALSLPLQRFINERLDLDYESESKVDMDSPTTNKQPRNNSANLGSGATGCSQSQKKNRLSAPPNSMQQHIDQPESLARESPIPESDAEINKPFKQVKHKRYVDLTDSPGESPVQQPIHIAAARLRRQLASHPSLEDIGGYGSKASFHEGATGSQRDKTPSRASSQNNRPRKKDQMDEKISSILTSIPANISLMQPDDSEDTSSVTSLPPKAKRELRSVSRHGESSRSGTPGPSLTITPAPSRRRHSHAPGANEMKVYHLHGGDKPVKLACRTVGRDGERVMARIGGGWSDLAEYLSVYAMHHRSRHISETPRVEVQELSSRESTPSYASPANRVVSGNGRTTPSRPPSVISNRPASSLAVRKTRRPSNASDVAGFRAVSAGAAMNASGSPMSTISSCRRLSVSSNTSAGTVSCANYSPSTTIGGGTSHTIPLGLAGPKPRSRRISMTPESEAWVEDVLGQARRSTSLRPLPSAIPQDQESTGRRTPALAKSRSINDIGTAGSSRRVALRGLSNR